MPGKGRCVPLNKENSGIKHLGAGELAQWIKVPADLSSKDLSLISGPTW